NASCCIHFYRYFLNFVVTHGGWSLTETFKRKQGEIRGNKNPHYEPCVPLPMVQPWYKITLNG
ncbi:hypothetical protein, partial [Phocaeicola dorei]|uniref:hypothetical protein n=1 Tax=Phocaeicola dorei TaxID=357276 RepID=UPI0019D69568